MLRTLNDEGHRPGCQVGHFVHSKVSGLNTIQSAA
jgi:hypothetical protein